MFNSISGIITGKFPKQVFIENNGIEWDICIPDSNLEKLPPVGNEAKVYTWLQHTDMAMALYGFSSAEERSLFFDLLKVDGIGAKGALKIMSNVSSGRLMDVLEKGDLEMLEKIPGVGKKTAGKMMLTLKGKLSLHAEETVLRIPSAAPYSDVVESLVSMGYDKRVAEQKIGELCAALSGDEDFEKKSQKDREDFIFKKAIVALA